jgi:cytochrome c
MGGLLGAERVDLFNDFMSADDGAALFETKCAACHGANGEGKPAEASGA